MLTSSIQEVNVAFLMNENQEERELVSTRKKKTNLLGVSES